MTPRRVKRVVVVSGYAQDKRLLCEITKRMNWDRDLRKLAIFGPVTWFLAAIVVVVGFGIGIAGNLRNLAGWARRLLDDSQGGRTIILISATAIFLFIVMIRQQTKNFHEIQSTWPEKAKAFFGNFRDMWNNLNYWRPFAAHPSDRDPLVLLGNRLKDPAARIGAFYLDAPYYQNVFVDSITVRISRGNKQIPTVRRLELFLFQSRWRWLTWIIPLLPVLTLIGTNVGLFRVPAFGSLVLVALELVIAVLLFINPYVRFHFNFYQRATQLTNYNHTLNPARLRGAYRSGRSSCGYGVLYASQFFHSLFGADAQYRTAPSLDVGACEQCEQPGGICADCTKYRAATWVMDTSVPTKAAGDYLIQIEGIRTYQIQEYEAGTERSFRRLKPFDCRRSHDRANRTRRSLVFRLPIKKFVSVSPTPDTTFPLYLPEPWQEDELHYVLVGGAEHQQCLVEAVKALNRKGYANIGIVEDAFLKPKPRQMLFTSEDFVSAVITSEGLQRGGRDFFLARFLEQEKPKRWIHLIWGMSARATKAGFAFWLDCYAKGFGGKNRIEKEVLYRISYDLPAADRREAAMDESDPFVDPDLVDRLQFELSPESTESGDTPPKGGEKHLMALVAKHLKITRRPI